MSTLRQPFVPSRGNYIAGAFVRPSSIDATLRVTSPADRDDVVGEIACSTAHAREAVAAAKAALPAWRRRPFDERASMLRAFAAAVKARREVLATAIARSIGKPLWEARTEVDAVVAKVEITLGAGMEAIAPRDLPSDKASIRHRPVGVMAVLGPFNFPAHLPNGHFVPALATGNTVVFKPSERAPLVGEVLAECMHEAGVPAGVFNVVQGDGSVAAAIVADGDVDGVCFTGSTAVGQRILEASARFPGRLVALELGGSNAAIVTADANLAHAAREIAFSAFVTAGQRCTATSRVYVERAAQARLMDELARLTAGLRVDHPANPDAFLGPIIDEQARARALARAEAIAATHEVVVRPEARAVDGVEGAYLSPGLFLAHEGTVTLSAEEFFAPLLLVQAVDSDESAVVHANASPYGLAAGVFCAEESRFERMAAELEVGICNWNRGTVGSSSRLPFGGVKASGNHRPAGLASTLYCVDAVAQIRWAEPPVPAAIPGFPH
jgi:succinylglutamic semialdehyde dehydrogenase